MSNVAEKIIFVLRRIFQILILIWNLPVSIVAYIIATIIAIGYMIADSDRRSFGWFVFNMRNDFQDLILIWRHIFGW